MTVIGRARACPALLTINCVLRAIAAQPYAAKTPSIGTSATTYRSSFFSLAVRTPRTQMIARARYAVAWARRSFGSDRAAKMIAMTAGATPRSTGGDDRQRREIG